MNAIDDDNDDECLWFNGDGNGNDEDNNTKVNLGGKRGVGPKLIKDNGDGNYDQC